MFITELGEFGVIRRIKQILGEKSPGEIVEIGDDTAVLKIPRDELLLATCDVQIEGRHFLKEKITPYQLGKRVAAVNLSDIAAMGGSPRYALVSLALPINTTVEFIEDLYKGMKESFGGFGAYIVGGNLARSPKEIFIDVTLLGTVVPDRVLLRSGAKPGDRVLVTGTLGEAAAGLQILLGKVKPGNLNVESLIEAYLTPEPQVQAGQILAGLRCVTAMADISDGLAGDIQRICEASRVDVEIWMNQIPISPITRRLAEENHRNPLDWALYGGEDYQLLFTAPEGEVERIISTLRKEISVEVTPIGSIQAPGTGNRLIDRDGTGLPLEAKSWDHFA
jgi:thiamine-monophosphate kinase